MMKNLLSLAAMSLLLIACSGALDTKLSEMNEPEKARKLLEALSPEELRLLQTYVVHKTMDRSIDYKMTVKEALHAQRKENEQLMAVKDAIR